MTCLFLSLAGFYKDASFLGCIILWYSAFKLSLVLSGFVSSKLFKGWRIVLYLATSFVGSKSMDIARSSSFSSCLMVTLRCFLLSFECYGEPVLLELMMLLGYARGSYDKTKLDAETWFKFYLLKVSTSLGESGAILDKFAAAVSFSSYVHVSSIVRVAALVALTGLDDAPVSKLLCCNFSLIVPRSFKLRPIVTLLIYVVWLIKVLLCCFPACSWKSLAAKFLERIW